MAVRQVYNSDVILQTLQRDTAVVDMNPAKIHSKCSISFVCRCGTPHEKRLDRAVQCGMFCPDCMLQEAVLKCNNTKTNSKPLVSAMEYDLCSADGQCIVLKPSEEIALELSRSYAKPSVSNSERQKCVSVTWFDMTTVKANCKKFSYNKMDHPLQAAVTFAESLQAVPEGCHISVTVADVIARQKWFEKHFRLANLIVSFPAQPVPIPAYLVGSWNGDGTSTVADITSVDSEIVEYWREYCSAAGLAFVQRSKLITYAVSGAVQDSGKRKPNTLLKELRSLGLIKEKHIPVVYKHNSEAIRLEILAGLIDTDGYLDINHSNVNSAKCAYEFSQSRAHEKLFDDFAEVARSLGMHMTKKYVTKMCTSNGNQKACPAIRGRLTGLDVVKIPVKLPRKKAELPQNRGDLKRFSIKNRLIKGEQQSA